MMISLVVDAVIAITKTIDRGLTTVEKNVRLGFTPRTVVAAQPAEAGTMPASATGLGGHHHSLRPTSELLWIAAHQVIDPDLVTQLRDHAAQLAAHGL